MDEALGLDNEKRKIIIDDNFLMPHEILELQKIMYLDQPSNFPWVFSQHSSKKVEDTAQIYGIGYNDNFQFVHPIQVLNNEHSPFAPFAQNVLNKFADKHNIKINQITKMKANLIPNDSRDREDVNTPHVDGNQGIDLSVYPGKLYVLLYYVNDSDGDTTMFAETYTGKPVESLTEMAKISPKAGKAVLFENNQYHAAGSPRHSDLRCVININFMGEMLDK